MTLYVLFHCNEWHEYSSFKLIGVVDEAHLQEALLTIRTEQQYSIEDMKDYIHTEKIELNDLDI